ncbi:chymotrypsin inhibitor-like isoform X2 [Bactrocera neohumeralis]|uniref:chymotrypsin inhibitor-like isoform X2 n=1 Tax=Bactrocera neohumeralis TaxID=98809 RepID=UPI0021650D68|nr:chymotrypsin inhibitor-like isoform X2 [Bactrocera neohumeralis]
MNTKFCLLFLFVLCIVSFVSAKPQGGSGCGLNEEFTTCGTACPPKCNQGSGTIVCTLQCIVGCQCKTGYLLDNQGRCVEQRNC